MDNFKKVFHVCDTNNYDALFSSKYSKYEHDLTFVKKRRRKVSYYFLYVGRSALINDNDTDGLRLAEKGLLSVPDGFTMIKI